MRWPESLGTGTDIGQARAEPVAPTSLRLVQSPIEHHCLGLSRKRITFLAFRLTLPFASAY
jgi:hypothetical protein